MIKATDVRVGNWILDHANKPQLVTGIQGWHVMDNAASGISLTPEILEKCGFTLFESIFDELFMNDKLGIRFKPVENIVEVSYRFETVEYPTYLRDLEFLHQLQNLYYALTGKELNYQP